ncbi:MAG: DUF4870 domain-containing protein [Solibacillus sp.]|jgi:uncharacterized Tic20 family protein|uniref:DUF4870 domain-containing protein n=1 Tax=unclassified Solibacillus TaxID=2637870 RepID=UPI0030F825A9
MDQSKGLSALGYLSFFFAPFIVPIVLFFVSKEDLVRHHAKRALISHIIPIILGIIFVIVFFTSAFMVSFDSTGDSFFYVFIIAFILYSIFTFILAIWNLVQAIKVLR